MMETNNANGSSGGISNVFIEKTIKAIPTTNFIGVYSAENFPFTYLDRNRTQKMVLICNLSPSDKPGTHFVTLCCTNNILRYFDSLALDPELVSPELYKSIKKCGRQLWYVIDDPIQAENSEFCGFYSMLYALLSDDYIKLCKPSGLKRFKKIDLDENDAICISNLLTVIDCI